MIKQVLWAAAFGLLTGSMFIVGRWTARPREMATPMPAAKSMSDEEIKYTYYQELIRESPTQEPPASVSLAPEPAANTASEKASPDRIAAALAKALGTETPSSVKTMVNETLPVGTGSAYAIQVASLPSREAAEKFVKDLQKKGHAAKLVQAEIPGKGKMYRVRIHGFLTREEADKYRAEKGIEGITVGQ